MGGHVLPCVQFTDMHMYTNEPIARNLLTFTDVFHDHYENL